MVPFSELFMYGQNTRTTTDMLKEHISNQCGGKVNKHGYIRKGAEFIKIVEYSPPELSSDSMSFLVTYECDAFVPMKGTVYEVLFVENQENVISCIWTDPKTGLTAMKVYIFGASTDHSTTKMATITAEIIDYHLVFLTDHVRAVGEMRLAGKAD